MTTPQVKGKTLTDFLAAALAAACDDFLAAYTRIVTTYDANPSRAAFASRKAAARARDAAYDALIAATNALADAEAALPSGSLEE